MSDNKRLEELGRENLCTHFILPLLKMNKFSFIGSNFVNSFLTRKDQLVVQVIDKHFVHGKCMIHPQFEAILRDRDYCYYVYRVPLNWIADLKLFKKGKYSEMSELAKDTIRVQSGLPNNTRMSSGKLETDIRILALDKHKTLKNWWEEMINPWEPLSGELLSIPDERSFIELDLLTPETGYMPIHKPSH